MGFFHIPVEVMACYRDLVDGFELGNGISAGRALKADAALFHRSVRVPSVVARDMQHLDLRVVEIQERPTVVPVMMSEQVEVVLGEALDVGWLLAGSREVQVKREPGPRPESSSTADRPIIELMVEVNGAPSAACPLLFRLLLDKR